MIFLEFNFDENGNLPAGEYPIDFDDLKQVFVDGFGTSYTRRRNWDGFNAFVKFLIDAGLKDMTIWVDGSFISNKENPNDFDFVTLIEPKNLNNLSKAQQSKLCSIFEHETAKSFFYCDPYIILVDGSEYNINRNAYWKKQWGHDRFGNSKGFVVVEIRGGVRQ